MKDKKEEEAYFNTLYAQCGPRIHKRAHFLLQNRAEADEVLQDAFLAFFLGRAYLRGEASDCTVLFQIVTFKAVDRLRSRSRWSGIMADAFVLGEDEPARQPRRDISHDGGMVRIEALHDLAIVTKGEDPQVLTAACLYFIEGKTQEEVCKKLGIKDRHLASRLLRDFAERARTRSAMLERGARS
jgi:RNA polymerase sigma-70 factor (ECF subfamily)